jgi:multidrug efflux system membrane fusion protein
VRAAEAALAAARLNLDFTEVRAPVSGRAGRALLTVGNLAQADQSVLTTVVSQDPVYVYFDADEHSFLRQQQAAQGGKGRPVRMGLASDEGFPHVGTLDFTDNQINAATGTVRMRARLPNPGRLLTPGLFARVQLQGGGGEQQALLIDDKAVLTDQDRKYVYVVGEGNKAERRDLELVWHRVRRNQRLVATLRVDGLIELADGSVHADPSSAATAAADLERPADGWRVWRFGEDGPTLGEAVGA